MEGGIDYWSEGDDVCRVCGCYRGGHGGDGCVLARCLETIDVCIWCMFVFMYVVVTVWGSVGLFVV